jgi:hypothetical protein
MKEIFEVAYSFLLICLFLSSGFLLFELLRVYWILKPSGNCPVQAEGYFLNRYFYFRSRWGSARIEFSRNQEEWESNNIDKVIVLYNAKDGVGAGWISKWFAYLLIYKGLFTFSITLMLGGLKNRFNTIKEFKFFGNENK